jgi:hypothetical protein
VAANLDTSSLNLAVADDHGVHFETGVPVTFRFLHNTEKAPYFGDRYGQDVEPAGFYVVHNEDPGSLARGWEQGTLTFQNPLVLDFNPDGDAIYGENDWKRRLARATGLTGKKLSQKLVALGYDGIVTVRDGTREIVALKRVESRRPVAREPGGRIAKSDCSHIQSWLYEYLSTDVDPYDFQFAVKDWIEQEEITDDGTPYVEPTDVNVEDLSDAQRKAFKKWLKTSGELEQYKREMPYESPAYLTLVARSKLPEGSWLIHFTNANFTHFEKGATLEGLHLSTWNRNKAVAKCSSNLSDTQGLHEVVFGFAFDVDRLPRMRDIIAASEKYGRHAVIFQCDCAVEAYHWGDEEHQSIFPVCSEYSVHLVSMDRDGVFVEDENGETHDFTRLEDLVSFLEEEPSRGRSAKPGRQEREETQALYDELKSGASEDVIRVPHDVVEAAARRTASQFAHHLLSADLDGNPERYFFDHADNKRRTPDGDIVVGSPRIEFGYFAPFKHGTIRTVRGRDRIDKVMVHPILVWDPGAQDLVLGGGTHGLNPQTGYASIWVRVNAASPNAKELRDHPERFTRQFATILLHEFTHIRDVIRPQDVIDPEKHRHEPGGGYDAFVKYFNSPHELRARMSQVVYEVLNVLQHDALGPKLRHYAELQRDNPNEYLVDAALARSKTWRRGEYVWTPENKARILRAVYRALEREGLLTKQRRPRLPRTQRSRAAEDAQKPEILLTEAQIEVARDNKLVGFIWMEAIDFLRLTIDARDDDSAEGFVHALDGYRSLAQPLEAYNAWTRDGRIRIAPGLGVMPSGKVVSHEGRHRAAALINAAGEDAVMLVGIELKNDDGYNWSPRAMRNQARMRNVPPVFTGQWLLNKDIAVPISLDGAIDLYADTSGARETTVIPTIWYHLTDRAHFKLDPRFAPADNAVAIDDRSGRPGIYLGQSVEKWVNGYGYWRPFVVEIKVNQSVVDDPGVHGRYGGEMFVPASSFDKLTVERVIPLDAYAREHYGEAGWIETNLGVAFDTGEPLPKHARFPGYRYPGPDVRNMAADEIARLKKQLRQVKPRRGGAEETATRDFIVPFPVKYLSMVPGDTDATTEPIDVRIYNDGSIVVMRGDVAKKDADALVAVRIVETYLPAEVWDWYYQQLMTGKTPEQVNPERYELQYVYDEALATRAPSRRSSRA